MSGEPRSEAGFDERNLVKETAKRRNAHFVNKASNSPLSKNYEEVGVWGEWEFGKFCGLMPRLQAGGDGGYDFMLPLYMKVDVKTSTKGEFLYVEQGRVKADIYVLAKCEEKEQWTGDKETSTSFTTTLLGWELASVVMSYAPSVSPRCIVNHSVPVEKLRPMEELKKFLSQRR